MSDLIIATTIRETTATIAEAICAIWESDKDIPAVYGEHCRIHSADLTNSLIAHTMDGQLVGIGIICRRGDRGYVLDFGIVPKFRGRGLGHRLFRALVAQMRNSGLREVTLLVNADNEPAIRIYSRAGFQQVRELVTLSGRVAAYAPGSAHELNNDIAATIVAWFGGGKATRPSWERDLSSLLVMSDVRAFENSRGFLLTRPAPYFPRQVDIAHIGLDPDAMAEDVNALLYAVSERYGSDKQLALPEEPVNSRAYRMLHSLGFRTVDRAYEMCLVL